MTSDFVAFLTAQPSAKSLAGCAGFFLEERLICARADLRASLANAVFLESDIIAGVAWIVACDLWVQNFSKSSKARSISRNSWGDWPAT